MEVKNIKNFICLSEINPVLSQDRIDVLLQSISKENREKCQRFIFKEDTLRTLYGELMVRHVLCQRLLVENKDIEILKNDAGKPYVKGYIIYFNISHAGDFVVCAFSQQEIGIDIEQIKEIDLNIARRFFHQQEYEDLQAQKKQNQLDYFYSLWTLKESYIKWLGTGLSTPLDSFCFHIMDKNISCVDNARKVMPFFKQFFIKNYKLSVCSMIYNFEDDIEKISIEEIIL